jgi:hypothetical protein
VRPHHLIFLMAGFALALAALLGFSLLLLGQAGQ